MRIPAEKGWVLYDGDCVLRPVAALLVAGLTPPAF
jgi:hypothetical protein